MSPRIDLKALPGRLGKVYLTIAKGLRRLVPEPVWKFIIRILYWREINILRGILHENRVTKDHRTVIVFPPALDWDITLFQRPQHLALAFAEQGALVFYFQARYDRKKTPFIPFGKNIYLCHVPVRTLQVIHSPVVYLLTWNSKYARQFTRPRILYDYIDDIHTFYGDPQELAKGHQYLLRRADVVVATARKLADEARLIRTDVIYAPNGVDYGHFARAARREFPSPPEDMQALLVKSRPVIGYYGALARWFDYDLLKRVAALRPGYQFVLIGPDYDGTIENSGIGDVGNIHWLGVKANVDLPRYLQYFDVAMIPFMLNDITHATSPLKLFEYMAGEKPIVITPMQESMSYPGVLVGESPEEFVRQLDMALQKKDDPATLAVLRQAALENTWERRAEQILLAFEAAV